VCAFFLGGVFGVFDDVFAMMVSSNVNVMLFMVAFTSFSVPTGGSNLLQRFFLTLTATDFLEMTHFTV
jgi:hypothetical protein